MARRGKQVPQRTLYRFCVEELGYRKQRATVRVADGEPGGELQMDFGRLGYLTDPQGRRRLLRALLFTGVFSRHMFVWLCRRETLADVIDGCEAAWVFFGGVFAVLVPDNLSAVVAKADPIAPRITDAFTECAQSRGFVIVRAGAPPDRQAAGRARGDLCALEFLGRRGVS